MIKKLTLLLFFVGSGLFLNAQIIINEILTNSEIELKNIGATMVDVTSFWFCNWPGYAQVGSANHTIVCGNLNMAPGSILVVSGFSLDYADSELGLYNSSAFSQASAMMDYVEWGSTGHQRSTVAVAAGIWNTGDFVPAFSGSASIEYDGGGNAPSDWVTQAMNSSCAENAAASGGCSVMEGTISTTSATTICTADGTTDLIDVSVMGVMGGDVSSWIITNTSNEIIELPSTSPIDVSTSTGGLSSCLIWHIRYETGLAGLDIGNNLMDLAGCFAISNSITITKSEPKGGAISTMDITDICALDGIPDPINVSVMNNAGQNTRWIIASEMEDILAIETAPPFDLSGAGAGTSLIWHLSYDDGLMGLQLGNKFSDLAGCYSFSNPIAVVRTVADGGTVNTGGATEVEVCVTDADADVLDFATSSTDANYKYVITDENNIITGLPSGTSNDFEGTTEGVSRVWGLSYTGNFTGMLNDNVTTTTLSDECYGLSSNFITVNRVISGSDCVVSTFEIAGEIYQLDLSPNPITEQLHIEIKGKDLNQGLSTLSIFSLEGKRLVEKSYQLSSGEQSLDLDLSDLSQGLYILQLRNSDKVFNDKFVKK